MADVQILAQGTKAAPLDYQVPQTSEILLRAAGATFDGTGAAGAFLPAIVITPPSGVPLPPFVTDTAVVAGTSAEVAFAPFLRSAASGGGSGITEITSVDGSVTVTNPFGPTADLAVAAAAGSGLPSAAMIKTATQTVAGFSVTQLSLDSTTFAATDGAIFTASGSNIVIHAAGLYAAYTHFVDDNSATDPTTTEFFPKWLGAAIGPNAPWQQIVPRMFNVNGPSGLQGVDPIGLGLVDSIANVSIAYVSELSGTVGAWLATLSASAITSSTCLLCVIQLQPISGATLATFPTYPF